MKGDDVPRAQRKAVEKPADQIQARVLITCGFLMGTCATSGHEIPLVLRNLMRSIDRLPSNEELEAALGLPLEMIARSLMNAGRNMLPLHRIKRRRK